jgi:periplasmic divalent cation tolerance protein
VADDEPVILLTTLGASTDAAAFAARLVADHLAGCVNVLPVMTSIYAWKGAIEHDTEQQLVIKTTASRVPLLAARFAVEHPYEVPEFVVIRAEASDGVLTVRTPGGCGARPGGPGRARRR